MRCTWRALNDNVVVDGVSFWRGKSLKNHLGTVLNSPYKEAFKDYWSTPMPWIPRSYGPKPKPGDPIPLRDAAGLLLIAKNNHMTPEQRGEEEDYKVLFNHREAKGRYRKDSFILPTSPVTLEDRSEDWGPLLHRLKVREVPEDLPFRIAAIRAMLTECNILVIPPEGGQIAEVEGPPGGLKRWYNIIGQHPGQLRNLLDILEIPYENAIKSLMPFRRIQTPASENFRFDAIHYIVTYGKMPCVRYCTSAIGEQMTWISPTEAIKRFNCGVLSMPTPVAFMMSELQREFPRYEMIEEKRMAYTTPDVITPELVHNPESMMATVLFPGDFQHSASRRRLEDDSPESPLRFRRFHYMKDDPWGYRAVYFDRPLTEGDDVQELDPVPAAIYVEPAQPQLNLPNTAFQQEVEKTDVADSEAMKIAVRADEPLPSQLNRRMPGMSMVDDEVRRSMGLDKLPTEIETALRQRNMGPELNRP